MNKKKITPPLYIDFSMMVGDTRAYAFYNYILDRLEEQWKRGANPDAIILPIENATIYGLSLYVSKEAYDKEQEEQRIRKLPYYY